MSDNFWQTASERHQEIAQTFYENIEVKHPPRARGECSYLCGRCFWAASGVRYPSYEGPRVENIK
jgi:hypothetical protein